MVAVSERIHFIPENWGLTENFIYTTSMCDGKYKFGTFVGFQKVFKF